MSGNEQTRDIEEIILHPRFDSVTFTNDISLLKVKSPFVFNEFVNAIPIPSVDTVFPDGMLCTISGWGSLRLTMAEQYPDILQWAEVPIVNQRTCSYEYRPRSMGDDNICAGDNGKDSCQGDSGGPMVCDGLLAGIVSWGLGCARKGFPGVYTRVSYFEDFIKSHAV